jgi:hypothetical protein
MACHVLTYMHMHAMNLPDMHMHAINMTANNTLVINMPAIGMLAIYLPVIMQSSLVGLLSFLLGAPWPFMYLLTCTCTP